MTRIRIGGTRDSGGSATVYKTANAFEVDELEGTSGIRRRIFFDDIFLVTYHRVVGKAFVLILGAICLLLLLLTGSLLVEGLNRNSPPALVGAGISGALTTPLLVVFLNRVIRKKDIITIFGRHGRARMDFEWRKARARGVFVDACKAARDSRAAPQRARAQAAPAPSPSPESDPPIEPAGV